MLFRNPLINDSFPVFSFSDKIILHIFSFLFFCFDDVQRDEFSSKKETSSLVVETELLFSESKRKFLCLV